MVPAPALRAVPGPDSLLHGQKHARIERLGEVLRHAGEQARDTPGLQHLLPGMCDVARHRIILQEQCEPFIDLRRRAACHTAP